jgi:hypothetical protein
MKIYIACGLTHVPREMFPQYVEFIHQLAARVAANGVNSVQYALLNSDPQLAEKPFDERARLCYLWDREMVQRSELIIAEASFPSTGMGIELQIAEGAGIPIVLLFGRAWNNQAVAVSYENPDRTKHALQIGAGYVSLMALGMPQVFRVVGYEDPQDGIAQIIDALDILIREKQA